MSFRKEKKIQYTYHDKIPVAELITESWRKSNEAEDLVLSDIYLERIVEDLPPPIEDKFEEYYEKFFNEMWEEKNVNLSKWYLAMLFPEQRDAILRQIEEDRLEVERAAKKKAIKYVLYEINMYPRPREPVIVAAPPELLKKYAEVFKRIQEKRMAKKKKKGGKSEKAE